MTREEVKNTPEIVDFMIDKSVIADSRMKLHKRIEELCKLAIKTLEQKSILDKIRTEIEQLPTTKCTETHRTYIDAYDFKKNVLMILDKYKTESEEL